MPVVRHGNDYAIDIRPRQNVMKVAVNLLSLGLLLPVFQTRLVDVAQRGVFEVVFRFLALVKTALEQAVKLHSAADEGDVDSIVRPKDARGRFKRELGLILRRRRRGWR